MPFLAWYIHLTWCELQDNKNKIWYQLCMWNAWNNQWIVPFTCTSYTNMFVISSQCWWVECCIHISNTKKLANFHYSFHIALTINTAKSLTTQKLQNILWCYSIGCLSLCLDQFSYINSKDVLSKGFYVYILISTLLAKEKETYWALMCGVDAPCYQHLQQGATTPNDRSVSP